MDSLSQVTLGAAVAVATLGRHTPAKARIAACGAVIGTLPDLDVLLDYGDVVSNMVLHRAQSHALFYQTLISPVLAYLAALLCRQRELYWRWWLATWLILLTHSAIDAMTVYGTQLALPFSNYPFAVGSIFIIDPLYTLPLLIGLLLYLRRKNAEAAYRANSLGVKLSSLYMLWTLVAQAYVTDVTREALAEQNIAARQLLVTPAPLNSVLWRVLVMTEQGYAEGFYSLLDNEPLQLHHIITDQQLTAQYQQLIAVRQLAAFSRGFYKLRWQDNQLLLTDLRMGQEGSYAFEFVIDSQSGLPLTQLPMRHNSELALPWLWRRTLGQALPSPYWTSGQ